MEESALVIVDMQNYYVKEDSDYYKFSTLNYPDSLSYIKNRVYNLVIPNIQKLIVFFREKNAHVIYLKLVSKKKDRTDLQKIFYKYHLMAKKDGFPALYPYKDDYQAQVLEEIKPDSNDKIFEKTTFSAFTSTDIHQYLLDQKITTLVFTGLATSQCVETTARDAADRNYNVIHIVDAQADYEERFHEASLFAQQGVTGGVIFKTDYFLSNLFLD